MAQQEKFNFHHTFQGTEYANGICNFHSIFYMIFCFRKPFYAPCDGCLGPFPVLIGLRVSPRLNEILVFFEWIERAAAQSRRPWYDK